ncbi:substrate-binding domain-containing protein [Cohnella candidum]|uniref:LacI family transcriptional regulator n=1 Tax=Cohnella candidum TaxID=2674991 RepID=A0A3G3K141_9BACL|nr:substrate-binding domain-containing protein [Cohnella candidum]AYQ73871.1 LacI family transcriptional regulator [Cohnella candidum]
MIRNRKRLTGSLAILVLAAAALWLGLARWSGPKEADIVVIIKSTNASLDFWQVVVDGVHDAAKEFKANVQVRGPAKETEVDEQIAILEKTIEERPDAIVLAASDYVRLAPAAEKARKNGIKLLILDSGIRSEAPQSIVATDNVKAGVEAGNAMLGQIEGPAKIAIVSYVTSAGSLMDREKGVRSVLEGKPNITLLETIDAGGDNERAYEKTKELLLREPDLYGIVGLNEPTSVGAGRAVKDLGLKGKVKLIGFDSSIPEIKLLDEGVMQATVIQRPFQMGYLSVKTALEAIRGKKVPAMIDTSSLLITKNNMYEEENQKLLFPFVGK